MKKMHIVKIQCVSQTNNYKNERTKDITKSVPFKTTTKIKTKNENKLFQLPTFITNGLY